MRAPAAVVATRTEIKREAAAIGAAQPYQSDPVACDSGKCALLREKRAVCGAVCILGSVRVREIGTGPRLVLVHGSVSNADSAWPEQLPLADRYRLVLVDRPGYAPNPPVAHVDFEEHAELVADLLRRGDHLCGHSYGGLVSLLAAARRPDALASLTVIEPPCLKVAAGVPAVDAFVESSRRLWEEGPREPEAFLRAFLAAVGSRAPWGALSPELLQAARTLMVERYPWDADIPLAELRAGSFRKLVVSGAHDAAFDAVCDVLERELPAERVVLPGAGHAVQRLGAPFNVALDAFLRAA
jgi:pimeloyl-ACP methyl ester carboxylesterase